MLYNPVPNNETIKTAPQSVTTVRVWHTESLCSRLLSRTWPLSLLSYYLDPEEGGVIGKVE